MYSLAHTLKPQFGRTWHEAVAIVQELASITGELEVLPLAEDLSLTDEGTLVLGFAGETGEAPVTALARLLDALLEGTDAPDGLRSLTADNASPTPAHASVQGFCRALAFFERPNRVHDLIAVASRLGAAGLMELDPDREIERLRERAAREATEGREPKKSREARKSKEKPEEPVAQDPEALAARRAAMLRTATVGLTVCALAALIVWGGFKLIDGASAEPVVIDAAQLEIEPLPDPASADAADASSPRGRQVPLTTRGDRQPRTTAPAAASDVAGRVPSGQPSFAGPVALPESFSLDPAAGFGGRSAANRLMDLDPGGLYSAADPRVQPPVLVRRQLPSGVNPHADAGYFDLVVDQFGLVEQVRLVSPTGDFRERMLVSAAKAWQFRPARLDGRPVRFQMQVPITISGERR
ncbi:MAG: hypothetical protein H0X67_12850 [Acidobacteria bacterium]|nr:hypothetical protein [Acidobacteriota bacterium]